MFGFSTCWNSHRHENGRALVAEVRELGFEYVELGHATPLSFVDGVQKAVAAGEIKVCSLHNFCPLPLGVSGPAPDYYQPSSRDDREREQAVRHTLRTIEFAVMVGAQAIVMHLGSVNMRNYTMRLISLYANGKADTPKFERLRNKAMLVRSKKNRPHLDQVMRTLEAIVPRAQQAGIKIGLETRLAIEEIPNEEELTEILAKFGTDVVGYWHDVGHTQMKENLGFLTHEAWLERFRGRTLGMHLQDFAPPAFDHLPPGRGQFDFSRLTKYVRPEMVLAWEIHHQFKAPEIVASVAAAHEILQPVAVSATAD